MLGLGLVAGPLFAIVALTQAFTREGFDLTDDRMIVVTNRQSGTKGTGMGHPVIHFEVTGKDGAGLASFFSVLFGWEIDTNNPMNYGPVSRDGNVTADGVGIGGGVGQAQPGSPGLVTFYVGVPDVEASLAKAESLGGKRLFGPAPVPGTPIVLGQFTDPEGHVIGLMQT